MLICLSNSLLVSFDHNIHSTFCLLSFFMYLTAAGTQTMSTTGWWRGHLGIILAVTTKALMLFWGVRYTWDFPTFSVFPHCLWFLLYFWNKGKSHMTSGFLYFVIFHTQMIQSLLEEHSQAMMLKHYPTKHLLPPLNQHSAMGPFVFFFRRKRRGHSGAQVMWGDWQLGR